MRLILLISTLLAISAVIPLGLVLTGTFTIPQLAEPSKKQSVLEAVVQAPKEPIREQFPASPEPKQSMAVEAPKQNVSLKFPAPEIIPPPKLPEPLPPQQGQQQPIQEPRAVVPKQDIREGIPSNFVLRSSLVVIRVAFGNEGGNVIRANLTDSMLATYPAVKEALIKLNMTTQEWLRTCRGQDCIAPSMEFRFSEQGLSDFIQMINPPLPMEPNRFVDRIERSYTSLVTYNGVRYLVFIDMTWLSP